MQSKFYGGCLEGGNGALGKCSLFNWCWNYVYYSIKEIQYLISVLIRTLYFF